MSSFCGDNGSNGPFENGSNGSFIPSPGSSSFRIQGASLRGDQAQTVVAGEGRDVQSARSGGGRSKTTVLVSGFRVCRDNGSNPLLPPKLGSVRAFAASFFHAGGVTSHLSPGPFDNGLFDNDPP